MSMHRRISRGVEHGDQARSRNGIVVGREKSSADMAGPVDDAPRQLQERHALAQRFGTDEFGSFQTACPAKPPRGLDIDSVVVQRTANAPQSGLSSHAPVQRLIVIPESELDYGMIVNVYQMLANKVDYRVTVLEAMHKAKLEPGEPLHMAGHGYGKDGAYGDLKVADLLAYFQKSKNPANIEAIHLLSCNTGKGEGKSYAAELADALKGQFTVTANQNLSYTNEKGQNYSKRDRTPDELKEYEAIFVKCDTQVTAAEALAATAGAEIVEAVKKETESPEKAIAAIFMQAGREILKVADVLFKALYAHQKILIKSDGKYRDEKKT